MSDLIDLAGWRFGNLLVLSEVESTYSWVRNWLCRCDCGRTEIVSHDNLRFACRIRCMVCITRRASRLPRDRREPGVEYLIWRAMLRRCYVVGDSGYRDYGARGISVCAEWSHPDTGYQRFLRDMGLRPSPDLSIDRVDNDGNYEPSNCRWATRFQQAANQRRAVSYASKYKRLPKRGDGPPERLLASAKVLRRPWWREPW